MLSRSARKYGASFAAAAAVALIGPGALAAAQTHHSRHHVVVLRHLIHHIKAHFATCPRGSTSPSYCTPPAVDSLFETFSSSSSASIPVSTSIANELLVAFVQSNGPKTGGQSSTVSGGGLTWKKAASQNKALGDAEVWYALAPSKISKQTITATASIKGYDENMTIVTFKNASGIGASGTFFSTSGVPTGTIKTTHPQSWVWASANDAGAAALRKVPSGQNAWVQVLDFSAKSTFWTQSTINPTPNAGTSVTINDTAPTSDPFNLVLVEIF